MRAPYLVLEVDRSIEIWDLRVDRLADHLTLTGMHERSHFYVNQQWSVIQSIAMGSYLELQQGVRKIVGSLHDLCQPNH